MKGYISLNNCLQHTTLSVSVKDPFLVESLKKLKREHKEVTDEILMLPLMLAAIHELIAYIAYKNDDTFDDLIKYIKEVEEVYPAIKDVKNDEVRTIYECTH